MRLRFEMLDLRWEMIDMRCEILDFRYGRSDPEFPARFQQGIKKGNIEIILLLAFSSPLEGNEGVNKNQDRWGNPIGLDTNI